MKRTELKRKTGLKRKAPLTTASGAIDKRTLSLGPPRDVRRMGGRAAVELAREKAGIPADAPKNKWGQSCAEKTCLVCGKTFLVQWSLRDEKQYRTCSRRCDSERKRQRGGEHRKGAANPNFKTGARVGVRDRAGERRWYAAMADCCEAPGCSNGPEHRLSLHHVVYLQTVRREKGDKHDPRNAMTLCSSCHMSHHRRGRVLPLSAIPDSVFAFAAETLGREAAYVYLTRRYAGDDPRADALLHARP